jgi:hypothetical protein
MHTATLLDNGEVLVAGGLDVSALASSEIYDPNSGTWNPTGDMNDARYNHTATLLNNGKVLVAGGHGGYGSPGLLTSTELYDPDSGTWSITGSMNVARQYHTATLLDKGKVLVAGGSTPDSSQSSSAELYDPNTGTWSNTGSMSGARFYHTATLLDNGKVLVAGEGYTTPPGLTTAELYDPNSGSWAIASDMNTSRVNHTDTLLSSGKVLVTGGNNVSSGILASAELYDPDTDEWETIGNMNSVRYAHTATLLNNDTVLVAGGLDRSVHYLASAELGTLVDANIFTGTLTLPSGWINNNIISVQFEGTSSNPAVNAGALSNDNITWNNWIPITSGEETTTNWDVGSEGANKPVYLGLQDIYDREATVVTGTINVDLTTPITIMTPLPEYSSENIPLSWSGSDALSGISTYDVQVRPGIDGTWTNILSNTTITNTIYNGVDGIQYYFRVRANDVAGNVEDFHPDYDAVTLVDTKAPTGTIVIKVER